MKRNVFRKISAVIVTTAVLFSTVFSVSVFVQAANNKFTPRLSAPDWSNKYYYDGDYNIFASAGYGLPNCTAYAYGRAYEILGTEPKLSWGSAYMWYDYNASNGYYPYGKTPKVGAIACWTYGSGGHVAVVETIDSNGDMVLSNSAWGGSTFYLTYANAADSNPGGNSWWTFQGYIYIIDSADVVPATTAPATTKATEPAVTYETGVYKVDASILNMRERANTSNSAIVDTISRGTKVTVTAIYENGGYTWGHIVYNGKKGWIALDYCTFITADVPQETVAPTTVAPTTVAPTTVAPTTAAPATVAPTTEAASTRNPYNPGGRITPDPSGDKPSRGTIIGDVNHDGSISILDATIIQKYLAGIADLTEADVKLCDFDGNGRVSIDDVTCLQRYLLK